MCTTLPKVHLALMGIERLVPGMDDLALFLSLLPRSATGQKLSVYTSLINAPLPGQERHLVLLDNGRTRVLADPVGRQALHCIRCSACLNICPVYREAGGHAYGSPYSGPIGAVITPLIYGLEEYAGLGRRHPLLAATFTIFLLSLAGIPPLAGFFAKFYVLAALIARGYVFLAAVAIGASVVALFLYALIFRPMYFVKPAGGSIRKLAPSIAVALVICLILTVLFGVWPQPLVTWAKAAVVPLLPSI
jgi:ferredoxin